MEDELVEKIVFAYFGSVEELQTENNKADLSVK